jgi:hypothetical protein
VKGEDASILAIQEKGDPPITAKRVASFDLYKLINEQQKGDGEEEERD